MPRYLWRRKGGAAGTRRMTQTVSEGGLREGCSCWGVKFSPSSEARRCMGLCHCQRAVRSGDRSSTSCKSNGALKPSLNQRRPNPSSVSTPSSAAPLILINNAHPKFDASCQRCSDGASSRSIALPCFVSHGLSLSRGALGRLPRSGLS